MSFLKCVVPKSGISKKNVTIHPGSAGFSCMWFYLRVLQSNFYSQLPEFGFSAMAAYTDAYALSLFLVPPGKF